MGLVSRLVVVSSFAALLSGCREERKPDPIGSSLATPSGLLIVGSGPGDSLLVANANFQLEFSSGSVARIDLSQIDETRRVNLMADVVDVVAPLPSFVGQMALTPDGTRVLVTNRLSEGDARSTPDRVFVLDAADLTEVDLATWQEGLQSALIVGLDPFGITTISLPPEGPGLPSRDRAYVANASDGSVSVLNLTPGSFCEGYPSPCVEDAVPVPRASVVEFTDLGAPAGLEFDGPDIASDIALTEHWDITFVEAAGICPIPTEAGVAPGYWRVEGSVSGLQRSHACTGSFYFTLTGMSFQINRAGGETPTGPAPTEGDRFSFDAFRGDFDPVSRIFLTQTIPGATVSGRGAGQLLYDSFRNRIYVTSRLTNFVFVLDADDGRLLGVFTVTSNVTGRDSRGLALAPDGSELYIVNRSPNALLVVDPDTMEVKLEAQLVTDAVVASVDLGGGPSEVAVSPDGNFAFVTGFDDDVLDIIDLRTRVRRSSTHLGDGPYALRMSPDGLRLYVGIYFDSSIDVIDVDPASPAFGEVITTIANDYE